MNYSKWTLIILGLVILVMGIAGLPGISDIATEPDWHAYLKIVIGVIAVAVAFLDRQKGR